MNLEKIGEIYTINQEENMETIKQNAKKIWTLAITNKKITIGVIIAAIIIYELVIK
jgi:hypothetical protein